MGDQFDKIASQLLYTAAGEKLYARDFYEALQQAGIRKGDILFVHSDLTAFGKLALFNRRAFCQAFIDVLQASVGEQGTLILPTFSYSFCKGVPYDVAHSPSTVGVLTEFFRQQPQVVRTRHPIFSAAISGKLKEYFQLVGMGAFDCDSIFGKLHARQGKLLFLGVDMQVCTYIHYVEQMHGVPYRFIKTFPGIIKEGQREELAEATYFVRHLDQNVQLDLSRFARHLCASGRLKTIKIGQGSLMTVEAAALYAEGCQLLDRDSYYFLKEIPIKGAP
jgi:aminoglycoside 3-N-acetyltransferase